MVMAEEKRSMFTEQTIEYRAGDIACKGFLVYKNTTASTEKRAGVLIAPDYYGVSDFAREKAKNMAELGYVGFVVDMYGDGKLAKDKDEAKSLMMPLFNDRASLLQRVNAGFEQIKTFDMVHPNKIVAMGFCFGGLVALDLARSGANFQGAISFHGILAPANLKKETIKAKILVLHGYDDPMATPENVIAFANEMKAANADWEIDMYGNAMHAFTKPSANDPANGLLYNREADARSWIAMKNFLAEVTE